MKSNVTEILDLCREMLINARLMTAYSGFDKTFIFPRVEQGPMWFVYPDTDPYSIRYSTGVYLNGPLLKPVPFSEFLLMRFFKRVCSAKVNQFKDEYLADTDNALDYFQEQYELFKTSHVLIVGCLREIFRFLCTWHEGFKQGKKDVLFGLDQYKHRFSRHPLLKGSHCEQFLLKIDALIISTDQPPALAREATLYIMSLNILLDKVEFMVRHYQPLSLNIYREPVVQITFDTIPVIPLFGSSRSDVVKAVGTINNHLKDIFLAQHLLFNKLLNSLMLCYFDLLDFSKNLKNYVHGDTSSINFDEFKHAIEAKSRSPVAVKNGLIEGQLYREMDYPMLFKAVFNIAHNHQSQPC